MEREPTLLKSPITFHHMHAGCVKKFDTALDDALECPDPPYAHSSRVYGKAVSITTGKEYDFSQEGRYIRGGGSNTEKRPYPQVLCAVEDDLSTLDLFIPAGEDPYWEKVVFAQEIEKSRARRQAYLEEMEKENTDDHA